MPEPDLTVYYRERERKQQALADRAASTAVAAIHRELAERYAALAEQGNRRSRS